MDKKYVNDEIPDEELESIRATKKDNLQNKKRVCNC